MIYDSYVGICVVLGLILFGFCCASLTVVGQVNGSIIF